MRASAATALPPFPPCPHLTRGASRQTRHCRRPLGCNSACRPCPGLGRSRRGGRCRPGDAASRDRPPRRIAAGDSSKSRSGPHPLPSRRFCRSPHGGSPRRTRPLPEQGPAGARLEPHAPPPACESSRPKSRRPGRPLVWTAIGAPDGRPRRLPPPRAARIPPACRATSRR